MTSVGGVHACGITTSGLAICWGCEENDIGQCDPPTYTFESIEVGTQHSCGMTAKGELYCWGQDMFGQSTPDQVFYAAYGLGHTHTCGVEEDGAALNCVGCGPEEGEPNQGQCEAPAGSFVAVDGGSGHSCGINTDGEIECWGCGDGWEWDLGQCTPP